MKAFCEKISHHFFLLTPYLLGLALLSGAGSLVIAQTPVRPWTKTNRGGQYGLPAMQLGTTQTCLLPQIDGVIKDDFLVNDDTIASTGSTQRHSTIAIDESGNFVIVWHDSRNGDADIYGQRYGSTGSPLGSNFRINDDASAELHWYPAVAMNNSSGAFVVAWGDKRSGEWDVYGQRYGATGSPLGGNFKVNDDATSEWQKFPAIAMNHAGDFVIVWQDERNGYREIYCQRYGSTGSPLGINFRVDGNTGYVWQLHPAIAMDSIGNFVVVWMDATSGDWDIWARIFDCGGIPQGASFKVNNNTGASDQDWPSIAMDKQGNFVVAWHDERYGDGDIYGQMYDSFGNLIGSNFPINIGIGIARQWTFSISMEYSGNFIVTWRDDRDGEYDIWAQRYNSSGVPINNNFKVNDDTGTIPHYSSACAIDELGNFIITWFDGRDGDDNIYTQRYGSTGSPLGPNFRVNDDKELAMQEWTSVTMASSGGFVITWTDHRNDPGDIYGQRYNASGDSLGSNFRINTDPIGNWQYCSLVATDSSGNFVVVWEDLRDMRPDVYCQRFNASGTPIGQNFRVNEDTTMGVYFSASPSVAMTPSGEFVVVWIHAGMADPDVWAQRYGSTGSPLGGNFKVNDDAPGALQYYPSAAVDNSFNFVVVWEDGRNGHADIYAQRYGSTGSPLGPNFRVNMDTGATHQYQSTVMMNSSGNFVVMWQDQRNGYLDIYAQKYDASGNAIGLNFIVNDDIPGSSLHYYPSGSIDESGKFIIVWTDFRNPDGDVVAQRYYADGTPWGSNIRINSDTLHNNHQWANLRSVATNGDILAFTWMDNRGEEGWDIYAKITDWGLTGIEETQNVAAGFDLRCYPNPFREKVSIVLSAKGKEENTIGAMPLALKIYDAAGRSVKNFSHLTHDALRTTLSWDGTDSSNRKLPCGVYFVRLNTADKSITKKVVKLE